MPLRMLVRRPGVWFGLLCVVYMAWALAVHAAAPPRAWSRLCGNCFASAVLVPGELGVVGLLVAWGSVQGHRYSWRNAAEWVGITLGMLLTPYVVGVPLFGVGALFLVFELLGTGADEG